MQEKRHGEGLENGKHLILEPEIRSARGGIQTRANTPVPASGRTRKPFRKSLTIVEYLWEEKEGINKSFGRVKQALYDQVRTVWRIRKGGSVVTGVQKGRRLGNSGVLTSKKQSFTH